MKFGKTTFYLAIGICLLFGGWYFLRPSSSGTKELLIDNPKVSPASANISPITASAKPAGATSKYTAETIKTSTNKNDVMALLQQATGSTVGTIVKGQDGKEDLVINGKKVFEGYHLGRTSMSTEGTTVIASYSARDHMIENADVVMDSKNGKLNASTASVWAINSNGENRKITPDNIHATNPIVSPDGRLVAFTGEVLSAQGIPQEGQVYIISTQGGTPVDLNLPSKGHIVPVAWNNNQLAVVTNEAENAVSFQLTWVQIKPSP